MRAPRRAGAIAATTPTTASTAIRPSCPGGTLKLTGNSKSTGTALSTLHSRVRSNAKQKPGTTSAPAKLVT